ncbi:hypothetical protein OIU77_015126 [Salix suchowensis]|uniref:Uncharacterized protein n=1 Tax=Salix suchowensis TaxID=1278906 RepID=A0ABQ8ZSE1_9ROSI|nr:hypothetical protein OIU77_015126 [Salix suchowensis]
MISSKENSYCRYTGSSESCEYTFVSLNCFNMHAALTFWLLSHRCHSIHPSRALMISTPR